VVKELKAAKLVDEKDDPAKVVAQLPDILRKATTAATSADAQKAAEAIQEAMKQLDVARAEAKQAKAEAVDARDKATKALAEADKTLAQAKADAKTTQDKLTESQAAQKALAARADKAERDLAAQAEQIEALRTQLADARSGAVVPLSAPEMASRERAAGVYGTGVELYFAGRYVAAEAALDRATKADPNDARYWYFLGLSRWMQGKKEAEEAFKKGAEAEARGQPNRRVVTAALERVQGPARQVLASYRP
jgi:tetratricopeptide (TPR) repeat protein